MEKFSNPHLKSSKRSAWDVVLWMLGYYEERTPLPPIPTGFSYPNLKEKIDPAKPTVTWVSHSTFWIKAFGKSILVDPIWNDRCSPFSFMGPARQLKAEPAFDKIEKIDCVIISHNHYDHLDKQTVIALDENFPDIEWIVPLEVKKLLSVFLKGKQNKITELNWWDSYETQGIKFTAVPSQHFSGRGYWDQNKTLWMGCVVEFTKENKRFYYAGDTGYNAFDFTEIGHKFQRMDLSLIPIGAYLPREFMKPVHINPEESVLIHQDVHSSLSVAGHWGTYPLSSEELDRPPYDLFCALQKYHVEPEKFRVLEPGQSINW